MAPQSRDSPQQRSPTSSPRRHCGYDGSFPHRGAPCRPLHDFRPFLTSVALANRRGAQVQLDLSEEGGGGGGGGGGSPFGSPARGGPVARRTVHHLAPGVTSAPAPKAQLRPWPGEVALAEARVHIVWRRRAERLRLLMDRLEVHAHLHAEVAGARQAPDAVLSALRSFFAEAEHESDPAALRAALRRRAAGAARGTGAVLAALMQACVPPVLAGANPLNPNSLTRFGTPCKLAFAGRAKVPADP